MEASSARIRADPRPSARRAAAEPELRVHSRDQLVFLLTQAAELEHGLMCEYLFAQWTLKRSTDEGVTEAQLERIRGWERQIGEVVMQEMLHLALSSNLLTALGAPPHFDRPNFPILSGWYPPGVQIALVPFGERALRHFIYLERPEGMALDDAEGFQALDQAEPLHDGRSLMALQQDFATVGGLYRGINQGYVDLAARFGEANVFIGAPTAQAKAEAFRWPEIIAVTDLASVDRAIDAIVEQGEGARGEWRNAHFGVFLRMHDELRAEQAADPRFQPARDVVPAYAHPMDDTDAEVADIGDPLTEDVADLFDAAYQTMLMALNRYFVHDDESLEQVTALARTAKRLMRFALKPLGIALTTLPVAAPDGPRAGPSFRIVSPTFYAIPHRDPAWHILADRVAAMGARARELAVRSGLDPLIGVADRLDVVLEDLRSTMPPRR